VGQKINISWSRKAEKALKQIFDFYYPLSAKAATNIVTEIVNAVEAIKFVEQYQTDDIAPEHRRMIVRHYKVLYTAEKQNIFIVHIFDTRQNPIKIK
jgi:plasmid stabilization system protein ParE